MALLVEKLQRLDLGIQGENLARTIEIDCTSWLQMFPNGTVSLYHKRNGDESVAVTGASFDRDTGILSWQPLAYDTFYNGLGEVQIRLTEGNVVKKARTIDSIVWPAVVNGQGETTASNWQAYINVVEGYKNAAQTSAGSSEDSAEDSEAWAKGTRAGSNVSSDDDTYHNNSKYYSEQAASSATQAATSAGSSEDSAEDSEAWAKGTRAGSGVSSGDDTYHNNSKYYSEQAASSATQAATSAGSSEDSAEAAEDSAEDSEAWAKGTRNGQAVQSSDETYHNNAKYYADQAQVIGGDIAGTLLDHDARLEDVEEKFTDLNSDIYDLGYDIANLRSDIAIVENGETATHHIRSGQFVVWEGALAIATENIFVGRTLSSSNLAPVSNGGLNGLTSRITNLASGIAIVEDGMTATNNITAGQFVVWRGALRKATENISIGTSLGSNLVYVSYGGLNVLNNNIAKLNSKSTSDLNSATETGMYTIRTGISNSPASGYTGTVSVTQATDGKVWQFAMMSNGTTYRRLYANSTWQDWIQLANYSDIPKSKTITIGSNGYAVVGVELSKIISGLCGYYNVIFTTAGSATVAYVYTQAGELVTTQGTSITVWYT